MPELILQHATGYVLIEEEVVDLLNLWVQSGRQPEAGGILIGYRRPPHLQVTTCTSPYKKDCRSWAGFLRRDPEHRQQALMSWRASQGQTYYVGDWHTHPVYKPSPSSVDIKTWRRLSKKYYGSPLLFIIVGQRYWHVQFGRQVLKIEDRDCKITLLR